MLYYIINLLFNFNNNNSLYHIGKIIELFFILLE